MTETVCAVVVTYNRKELLSACVNALLGQSRIVDKILIIDNASTDGTQDMLHRRGYAAHPSVESVRLPENTGGAGGFYTGMFRAFRNGYDWFWMMDDDTVPEADALERLLQSAETSRHRVKLGFVASRVVWTNGDVHRMNVPWIESLAADTPFNSLDDLGVSVIVSCSFVSSLVSREAVSICGLPLARMYIWGDDVEYFSRLTQRGYIGIYCPASRVVHNTADNRASDLLVDDATNFWKYRYGIRNLLYVRRARRGMTLYLLDVVHHLVVKNTQIALRRKDHRMRAIAVNTGAVLGSLAFAPQPVTPH